MSNRNTGPAILITIPLSHYCEKVRWALDRVALPYREEPHAPLLHWLATKRNEGGTGGRRNGGSVRQRLHAATSGHSTCRDAFRFAAVRVAFDRGLKHRIGLRRGFRSVSGGIH
jgi:hypothetical protein